MSVAGTVNGRPSLRGYTLVETLVALVLVSAGMLGSAAYLTRSLSAMRAASHETAAAVLTSDLAGRMRAHAAHAQAFADAEYACPPGDERACDEAAAARAELAAWRRASEAALPEASALVAPVDGPASSGYSITLSWLAPGGARATQSLIVTLRGG